MLLAMAPKSKTGQCFAARKFDDTVLWWNLLSPTRASSRSAPCRAYSDPRSIYRALPMAFSTFGVTQIAGALCISTAEVSLSTLYATFQ